MKTQKIKIIQYLGEYRSANIISFSNTNITYFQIFRSGAFSPRKHFGTFPPFSYSLLSLFRVVEKLVGESSFFPPLLFAFFTIRRSEVMGFVPSLFFFLTSITFFFHPSHFFFLLSFCFLAFGKGATNDKRWRLWKLAKAMFGQVIPFRFTNFDSFWTCFSRADQFFLNMTWPLFCVLFPLGISAHYFNNVWRCRSRVGLFSRGCELRLPKNADIYIVCAIYNRNCMVFWPLIFFFLCGYFHIILNEFIFLSHFRCQHCQPSPKTKISTKYRKLNVPKKSRAAEWNVCCQDMLTTQEKQRELLHFPKSARRRDFPQAVECYPYDNCL